MLAVPPNFLELLQLAPGAKVSLDIQDGKLVIAPQRPRYRLDELLAQCDETAELSDEDHVWLDAKPTGNELL